MSRAIVSRVVSSRGGCFLTRPAAILRARAVLSTRRVLGRPLSRLSTTSSASNVLAAAVSELKASVKAMDNADKLILYALYKQATEGPVSGPEPGFLDFVAKAKHGAWARLGSMSR